MKDIFLSIFKSTEERLKNPFIGTFLLSILIINWKPISVYLFSNQKIEDKINFISSNYDSLSHIILLPLLISIIYIVALPYLMWLFESLTFKSFKERNQNLYKNKIIDIEGKKSVALSEIELENLKADYKEKADLNRQIESLKLELSSQEISNKNLQEKIESLTKRYIELEKEILDKNQKMNYLYAQLEDVENENENFLQDYRNTTPLTIKEFIQKISKINDIDNQIENILYIQQFNDLGLISIAKNLDTSSKSIIEYFEITQKGLFFIKMASKDRII